MSHTPGPWIVGRTRRQETDIDAPNGDETIKAETWFGLATVYGHDDEPECGAKVMNANARLIAAAPDLLEALKMARKEFDGLPRSLGYDFTHIPMIDAAIAKAEGKQ